MSLDNDQYRELFIEEAKEHIECLTKSMLTLEKEPQNRDIINMLFRSAHTLKGSSGMMGYKDFQELTHKMEDVFDGMRKGNVPTPELITVLLECVDALSARLERIQKGLEGEIEVETLKKRLLAGITKPSPEGETKNEGTESNRIQENTLVKLDDNEKDALQKAKNIGEKGYYINLKFSDDCSFKGIRANMILSKISKIGEIVKTVPDKKELDEESLKQGFKLVVTTKIDEKELERCTQEVLEVENVKVTPIESLGEDKGQKTASMLGEEKTFCVGIENGKVTKVLSDVHSAQTVRVKFDQLDKLMNWVGELVINKIALLQATADIKNDGLKRITENIDRLTADLQDLVMQVRMVPVSQIFDRFPRLVRDLSLKKNKKIDLVMEGRDIEVDRTVLDEIGEPLIHLLRNSIDHGIETPSERWQAKKPEKGTIRLSAQRNGDHVIIEVEDDGAGIDPEKIKKAAIKKGFATEVELEKMTREQIINMIFLPGFSTAKEVTDTSGRGVGMDVVKTKITALGGTVHLETQLGKGTKTTIKLPLTLAIIQAILVNDSGQTFAIPTSQVSEIVRAKKSEVKSLGKTEAIVVRDKVVPVVHLHKVLGLECAAYEEDLELLITYLNDENSKIGLVVDSVVRQQDILVKSLSETLSGLKGISGATILGDGQVVLVLDVGQLVSKSKN
ncbi:MAG: chemotaxis protein CheA [Candidatus Bathyarchaeota archaeon]|nr:chemotaxis protein CheA [Candidatus Bathyarchaeota archaeon]